MEMKEYGEKEICGVGQWAAKVQCIIQRRSTVGMEKWCLAMTEKWVWVLAII